MQKNLNTSQPNMPGEPQPDTPKPWLMARSGPSPCKLQGPLYKDDLTRGVLSRAVRY
jgi:hypothetical protein